MPNRFTLAAVLAAGLLASAPAAAQQTIQLTAIDGYPARAMWVKEFAEYFIPEVDRRLAAAGGKYKIKWNQAYGGQIVKPGGVLEGIQKGLGDIGVVTTPFHADKVPLLEIAYVTPFTSLDPKVMARVVDELAEKYPAMKKQFEDYNQVYLSNGVVLDNYVIFSKQPLKTLADMKGVKVAGAGTNLRYFDGVGGVGVSGSSVNYYNMLQTGVVNAAVLWTEGGMTFKLNEVAPHILNADLGPVNSKVVTVNKDVWAKLPPEVRQVLVEVARDYRDRLADVAMARAKDSKAKFTAAGGTWVDLSPEARAAWAKSMPNMAKEWAARMDAKGLPGTDMLKHYMDRMRASGQKPVRDWDRE